jgi:molybdopterin adenylyltransferase
MNLPEKFETLIITLSDRASRGEYQDLSGPRVREKITDFFASAGWSYNIKTILIPDEASVLKELIIDAGNSSNIIITTGGTGIGPRDITTETVLPLLSKEIPGIMEFNTEPKCLQHF